MLYRTVIINVNNNDNNHNKNNNNNNNNNNYTFFVQRLGVYVISIAKKCGPAAGHAGSPGEAHSQAGEHSGPQCCPEFQSAGQTHCLVASSSLAGALAILCAQWRTLPTAQKRPKTL
jgi:hypothetical protein